MRTLRRSRQTTNRRNERWPADRKALRYMYRPGHQAKYRLASQTILERPFTVERLSWLRKKLIKWFLKIDIDVEEALKEPLHSDIDMSNKQRAAFVLAQNCPECQAVLQQVRHAVFVCPFCVISERFTGPIVLPESAITPPSWRSGGVPDTPRPFLDLVRKTHQPNVRTQVHRAIHWQRMS